MEERKDDIQAGWDPDFYGTGSTQPGKDHRGTVAVLLILAIVLISLFGVMRSLNKAGGEPKPSGSSLVFQPSEATGPADTTVATDPPQKADPYGSMELHQAPGKVDNVPQSGGLSLQEIYERSINSVVSITCRLSGGSASGTGVVLTANGYIVTNCHVVEGAQSISVRFTDERELPAQLIGADSVSDLAVLYVQAEDLSPATFGDSSDLRVGDAVVAIGDPLGIALRGTMTDGIICAVNRDIESKGRVMTLIQTNAALNSGNSGGPLINCFGQVIGINTMKIGAFTDSAGVEGLGFAIPSTTVKEIVDQLISQGYVSGRPSLGVEGETVSELYQRYYRLPAGYYINKVLSGGSADQAGLNPGDIILSVDGVRIGSAEELDAQLYAHQAGEQVELVIYRNRAQYTVTLLLEEARS